MRIAVTVHERQAKHSHVEAGQREHLDAAIAASLESMSPSETAAAVAKQLGVPRKRAYARVLEMIR